MTNKRAFKGQSPLTRAMDKNKTINEPAMFIQYSLSLSYFH